MTDQIELPADIKAQIDLTAIRWLSTQLAIAKNGLAAAEARALAAEAKLSAFPSGFSRDDLVCAWLDGRVSGLPAAEGMDRAEHKALHRDEALAYVSRALPSGELRIGQEVRIREAPGWQSDWRGIPLWVVGINVQPLKTEPTYALSDRWPPQHNGDITTDFAAEDIEALRPQDQGQ